MGLFGRKKDQNKTQNKEEDFEIALEGYETSGLEMPRLVDSMNLLVKTINPSTYASRAKLASNDAVMRTKDPRPVWNGLTCGQIYAMLNDREKKTAFDKRFIDRLFEAGKEDRLTFQMYEVGYSFSDETLDYFLRRLNGKKYHFCKVGFPETNKLYTYVTKDASIKPGDSVTIPTGNGFVPDSKLKQVVEVFDMSLEELEFPLRSLRCVEEKLKSIICPHCGAPIEISVGQKFGKCTRCQSEFYLV